MIKIESIHTRPSKDIPFFTEDNSSNELNMFNRAFIRYKHLCSVDILATALERKVTYTWRNEQDYFEFITLFGEEVQDVEIREYKYNIDNNISFSTKLWRK